MITILRNPNFIGNRENSTISKSLDLFSFKFLLIGFLFIVPASRLLANAGQLDPAFGPGGQVIVANKTLGAIAKQPDGKLIVGRSEFVNVSRDAKFSLTRYNLDGSVDNSFGNGEVLTDFNGGVNSITSITVHPNGKIVAAGYQLISGLVNLVIAKYNTDGTPDLSFHGDGKASFYSMPQTITSYNVVIGSGEKIVASSSTGMVRINANGSLESTISYDSDLFMTSLAIQTDNKVIVAGYNTTNNNDFVVIRFNTDGTRDDSFADHGRATTDVGSISDRTSSIAIQANGKIVVGGYTQAGGQYKFILVRYNVNGTLDNDFDGDGILIPGFGPVVYYTVAVQDDGKIVAAGGGTDFQVARFNANGTTDNSFNGNGYASVPGTYTRSVGAVISGNDLYVVGTDYYSGSTIAGFSLTNITTANGLSYRYYTGDFNMLPEFNTLIPAKTGLTPNVDISTRPAGTADHFAFVWEGYINLQTPGTYTFETVSDDGSKFYFNSFYSPSAVALVKNDGIHAAKSETGTVNIPVAGLYPIAVTYFEKDGGESMQVYWTPPGMTRQLIPTAVLAPRITQADNVNPTAPGNLHVVYKGRKFVRLDWGNSTDNVGVAGYQVYSNGSLLLTTAGSVATIENLNPNSSYNYSVKAVDSSGNLSDFSNQVSFTTASSGLNYKFYTNVPYGLIGLEGLNVCNSSSTNNIDISVRPQGMNENYAFLWQGYINIPTPGTYTFETLSDDGSRLYFNTPFSDIAAPLIDNFDNNGLHAPLSVSRTINIPSAGLYPIAITYHQYGGGQQMQFYWQGPGFSRQLVPDAAFTDDTRPASLISGLNYKYYEGSWSALPDFTALTPVKTGQSSNVDISQRTAGHDDNFAFVWEGYINVPAAGDYTFETISDDGSKLYFNSRYVPTAIATVNNDGIHAATSVKSTVHVGAAGYYPIAISFFEGTGDQKMEVYWSGPGITRQVIPSEAFSPNPSNQIERLSYKYYQGAWTSLPDFNMLTPVRTGTSPNVDITVRPTQWNDIFAFTWQGYINIPAPGTYIFETVSDDGSKLYFNNSYSPTATATVNNDGIHAARSATGSVFVNNAGVYPIAITYFEQYGGESMEVYWTGPGIPRQRIPNDAFTLLNLAALPAPLASNNIVTQKTETPVLASSAAEATGLRGVYPNPFDQRISIDFYNPAATNDITVGIFDLNGRKVYSSHPGKLPAGNNIMTMNLSNVNIKDGVYIVQLQKNGIAWQTMKIVKMKK